MRRSLIITASLFALAATSAPALAAWGCGAQGVGGQGRTWNFASSAMASKGALDECRRAGGHRCRIIGCSPNVDSEWQADSLWRPAAPDTVRCRGGFC
jgi:hypothetical protein